MSIAKGALAPLLLLSLAGPAMAASAPAGSLWPCIQPKVDSLGAAQMWSGPSIEGAKWQDDRQVADLVPLLVARRTSMEEVTAKIDAFAKEAGPEKKARLTLLFAGVFEEINALRSRILVGIERYSKHQIDLAARIKDESLRLANAKKSAASDTDKTKAADIEKELLWDTRIYDSRTQMMTAICETPVILDQRAFAIAREIQNVME